MSLFAKHDNLSTTINIPYRTISFQGSYAILNQNSNISIKNTVISGTRPSFIINNGTINIIDTTLSNIPSGDIVIDNSKHYVDDQQFNKFKYSYIEKGSVFKYPNISYTNYNEFFNTNSNNFQLVIPITCSYFKGKEQYIEDNHIENFGTGNQYYSTHFLNNGNYGYWGNKFGGQWIKDCIRADIINISDSQECNTFFNSIPKNLNGYEITINYNSNSLNELNLKNFYNGLININFTNSISNGSNRKLLFNIQNNNLTVNLNFVSTIQNVEFTLNDNKDINVNFKGDVNGLIFQGINNFAHINIFKNLNNTVKIFYNSSYGNNITLSATLATATEKLATSLENNQSKYGNFITVLSYNKRITDLVNDKYEFTEQNEAEFMNFTIDEVHPKKYRDVIDIGTIVGWPAHLHIPRGYYECNGQTVRVDLHNPQDEFYNGQLAYYLNGNLTTPTIKLPDIPSAKPTCMTQDPYYHNNNFIPVGTDGIVYIIKYNNNFENKKGLRDVIFSPDPVIPPPANVSTYTNVSFAFSKGTTDGGGIYYNVELNPTTVNTDYVWDNWPFTGAVYTMSAPYITGEHGTPGDHVFAQGTITWVINRVIEEYGEKREGYYQLSGLKTCIWNHQTEEIWASQSYLYIDFSNAIIDCINGQVNNVVIHYSRHHNNGNKHNTPTWQSHPVVNSFNFDPNITTEQYILNNTGIDRAAVIEPNTVSCKSKFTITVTAQTIILQVWGNAWHQDGDNGNWSYFKFWHPSIDENNTIGAEYVLS